MRARLKSGFWVSGFLRQCDQACVPAVVARKGDADAGALYLTLDRLDGTAELLGQSYGPEGPRWVRLTGPTPVPRPDVQARLARETKRDPDLWIIDIELRAGLPPLNDPVEELTARP